MFFLKQKTAYKMRISDWSSDVCSSDLRSLDPIAEIDIRQPRLRRAQDVVHDDEVAQPLAMLQLRIEEAVDHRQAIALPVGQAGADQPAGAAILARLAIFDAMAFTRGL